MIVSEVRVRKGSRGVLGAGYQSFATSHFKSEPSGMDLETAKVFED